MIKHMLHRVPTYGIYAFVLFTSLVLLLIANYCGVGFTSDSYRYLDIAEQIGKQGLFSATGLNIKPPVYPLIIYLLGPNSIFLLNVLCFACSVSILFFFGLELKSNFTRWVYWGLLIFSTPLYLVHSFAWTEPLFITVLLLAFHFIQVSQNSKKVGFLYMAVGLLFLLPLIRFAGIFIVLPTLVVIYPSVPSKIRGRAIALISLAFVIYSLWVINYADGFAERWQTFLIPFKKGDPWHYTHNLTSYLEGVSLWLMPYDIYQSIRLIASLAFLMGLGYLSYYYLKLKHKSILFSLPVIFLCYYILLHFVFKVEYYSAERYLTPLYNLLILSLLSWWEFRAEFIKKRLKQVVLILLLLVLAYNAIRSVKNVFFWNQVRCTKITQTD